MKVEFSLAQDMSSMKADNLTLWDNKRYAFQIKFDGARHLLIKDSCGWSLTSRCSGADVKAKYPHLWLDIDRLPNGVYDGEIIAPTKAQPLGDLYFLNSTAGKPEVRFIIFDVLAFRGMDTTHDSYEERYQLLKDEIEAKQTEGSRVVAVCNYSLADALAICQANNGEGIIIRDNKAQYIKGRSRAIMKWKRKKEETFSVFEIDVSKSRAVLELLDSEGKYAGRVCVCASEHEQALKPYFKEPLRLAINGKIQATFKAEVQYEQRCANGLRTPVLKRLVMI